MIMLGFALQRGWLPVSLAAVARAIEINGVAVEANLAALGAGRRAALGPAALRESLPAQVITFVRNEKEPLDALIARRIAELRAYQNPAYAERYEKLVQKVHQAELRVTPGTDALTRTVAIQAHRAMAYKDEYEVARLYSDGRFQRALSEQFEGDLRLSFHLAPPLLSRRDPATGGLRKRRFGPWVLPAMKVLAKLKGLRGSALDIFGYSTERRMERQLAETYIEMASRLADGLEPTNHRRFVEIATLPQTIRGFGHVKERKLRDAVQRWRHLAEGTAAQPCVDAFADAIQSAMASSAIADVPTVSV